MEEKKLTHDFCAKFKAEITDNSGSKLRAAILCLLDSKSATAPLKKMYLKRECQKRKNFLVKFTEACETLRHAASTPERKLQIVALRQEISGQ